MAKKGVCVVAPAVPSTTTAVFYAGEDTLRWLAFPDELAGKRRSTPPRTTEKAFRST